MNKVITHPLSMLLFTSVILLFLTFNGCSENSKSDIQNKRSQIIMDSLDDAEKYFNLHPAFKDVFTFLREKNLSELSLGEHDINGDRLFCIVQKRPGRTRSESRLEAHRRYIDIQYVIAGIEEMGWKLSSECEKIDTPYDENTEKMYFKDEPVSWTKVSAGSFAIFFPEDSHAPLVSKDEIHKIVFKVAVE
jgi:YhcH/YjgK/YiaL family protein